MYLLVILLMVIVIPIGYALFATISVEVNSVTGFCGVRLGKGFYARMIWEQEELSLKLKFWIFYKRLQLFPAKAGAKEVGAKKVKMNTGNRKFSIPWILIKRLLKSFRIKKCYIDLDTGDMPLNALLYPVFYSMGRATGKTFRVNFEDRNVTVMILENRLSKIASIFIQYFLTKKSKKWTT